MKKRDITVPIYNWQCRYVQIDTPGDYPNWAKSYKAFLGETPPDELKQDDAWGYCSVIPNYQKALITLYEPRSRNELVNVLVHETYHVVRAITTQSGVEDQEAEAYLIGWLSERLVSFALDANPEL